MARKTNSHKKSHRDANGRPLRFSLSARNIAVNETNEDVYKVQQYLRQFGYLNAAFRPKTLDNPTQTALRDFQTRVGLEATGALDPETATELEKPRCGVPNSYNHTGFFALHDPFAIQGCSYKKTRTLTYAVEFTGEVDLQDAKTEIGAAFTTWQREIPVDFQEVGSAARPTLRFNWFLGEHGDGERFRGPGNVVAHAFGPCGQPHQGKCHFDAAEVWRRQARPGVLDIQTVALHEIGHLLGLTHPGIDNNSVMFELYRGPSRSLAQQDKERVQAIYGRRGPSLSVLAHYDDFGDQKFRDNEFTDFAGRGNRGLKGFQIDFSPPIPGVKLRYLAHIGNGDLPFTGNGSFLGARNDPQARPITGFAIELTGQGSGDYNVLYAATIHGIGDTNIFNNGEFCGSRDDSKPIEAILVRVEPK